MVKEKTEFKWDTETAIGGFTDGKARFEVSINELNDKTYVQATKYVKTQAGEKRAKNFTMPLNNFDQLNDLVTDWKLKGAFGSTTELQAPPKRDVPLKQKQQPAMKGKKRTVEDRAKENSNFGSLSEGKQELLLDQVRAMDDEYGMVTIGVTKTNFIVEYGMSFSQAEGKIKKAKGFSRAEVTNLG